MSMRLCQQIGLLLLLGSAGSLSLSADITIGTADYDYAKPFGDGTTTRYQQLYDSSDFSGPIEIQGLGFFVDLSNFFLTDPSQFSSEYSTEYQVYLTDVAPGTDLGTTINTPPPLGTLVVDGVPSMDSSGFLTLLFSGAPFLYDPTTGDDLLLDIVRVTAPDISLSFFLNGDSSMDSAFADNFSCPTGCVYDGAHADPNNPGSILPALGLVTDFIEPATVPEPSFVGLLGLVLAGLALAHRLRSPRRS